MSATKKAKERRDPFIDALENDIFIDKTLFLKAVFGEEVQKVLVTAPPGFGKSTNLDMVKKFVEIKVDSNGALIGNEESPNYETFKDDLLVFDDQIFFNEHFATRPVIYVDFKDVTGASFEEVVNGFRNVLRNCFLQYKYLPALKKYIDEDTYTTIDSDEIKNGLRFLSGVLHDHFQKNVFLLIDNYDAPINNALFEEGVCIRDVSDLLTRLLSKTLKDNDFVEKALITGTANFAAVTLSGVNIKRYIFLTDNPFSKFHGLTEPEIDALLKKVNIGDKEALDIKSYFNGYRCNSDTKMFSTQSVLNYLQKKAKEQSPMDAVLSKALKVPVIESAIQKLFQHSYITIKPLDDIKLEDIIELRNLVTLKNPDLFLGYLLQHGFVTYVKNAQYEIMIPNKEMHRYFQRNLAMHYSTCSSGVIKTCAAVFDRISQSSKDDIYTELVKTFKDVIAQIEKSAIDELRVLNSYLFRVLCLSEFTIADEMQLPSNKNTSLVITKNDLGVIVELTYKSDSTSGLKKIVDEKYYEIFNGAKFKCIKRKIYLGVNVDEDLTVTIAKLTKDIDLRKATYFAV